MGFFQISLLYGSRFHSWRVYPLTCPDSWIRVRPGPNYSTQLPFSRQSLKHTSGFSPVKASTGSTLPLRGLVSLTGGTMSFSPVKSGRVKECGNGIGRGGSRHASCSLSLALYLLLSMQRQILTIACNSFSTSL